MPAKAAMADPTVTQIEAQLRAMWNEAEPLIERYIKIPEVQDQLSRVADTAGILAASGGAGQARVGAIAADVEPP
jgi:hypothetical protein